MTKKGQKKAGRWKKCFFTALHVEPQTCAGLQEEEQKQQSVQLEETVQIKHRVRNIEHHCWSQCRNVYVCVHQAIAQHHAVSMFECDFRQSTLSKTKKTNPKVWMQREKASVSVNRPIRITTPSSRYRRI